MSRALVLANRIPFPLDDGWKVRTFHVIRSVAAEFDTTVAVFGDAEQACAFQRAIGGNLEVVAVPAPRAYSVPALVRGLVTCDPVHVWNQRSPELERAVRAAVGSAPIDVALAELTFMAPYFRLLDPGTLRVVDTHNIDSLVLSRYIPHMRSAWRRSYARVTARKMRRFETRTFSEADLVWVCSENERDLLGGSGDGARIEVIPNGVDTAQLAPTGAVEAVPGRLLFFGRLDYYPNDDGLRYFVESILPLITARHPAVELHVAGIGATPALQRLAAARGNVRLLGRVADLGPVLESAEAVVVPLRMGGGTRLKILEALALARPVISTTVGAEGLALQPSRDLLVADSAEEFAGTVCRVLDDGEFGARLGCQGRVAVARAYDWDRIGAQLRRALHAASAASSRRRR